MKGFAMDETGDVVILNNEIPLVVGTALVQQKVKNVLGTKLKEWFFDWDEGINHDNMLGKNIDEDMIRYEVEQGLHQVDSTFTITDFSCEIDKKSRTAIVKFNAVASSGEEVGGEYTWA